MTTPTLRIVTRCSAMLGFALGLLPSAITAATKEEMPVLVPQPAELHLTEGSLPVLGQFTVGIGGADDGRLLPAVRRMLQAWSVRTGVAYKLGGATEGLHPLVIQCERSGPALPKLGEDESYTLEITVNGAVLKAPTTTGALRGLATLTQLLRTDGSNPRLPCVSISDRPRFAWRGLLIDVARHWQPAEVIRRELDGMALVKLNVLHLHLTDDQGFRIESHTHPELHTKASDGNYFTQEQMRGLLAYAHERGIRVVPEFDVPGHATAWCVAHPELASAPGPYVLCRHWGVENPVLDPTNEALYPLLDEFFGEMAALFPDDFLHIGGDENNGVHWSANTRIQEFIRANGLHDNAGLHAWFNRRLLGLLKKHGKRFIGWDEILHPDLPADSVIHSWRGPSGVVDAVRAGHEVVLSHGYYIDINQSAAEHYTVDPLPADSPLSPEQQARVLGGEATMWSEWVTPDIIDSRIWPRAAAVAERLWSPRSVSDISSMYRRLPVIHARLQEAGLNPTRWPRIEMAGVDPKGPVAGALGTLASVVEPVKIYQRGDLQPDIGQLQPLNELADWALPESRPAREFNEALEKWLMADGPLAAMQADALVAQFAEWTKTGELAAQAPVTDVPRTQGRARMARSLAELSRLGIEAVSAMRSGHPLAADRVAVADSAVRDAAPNAAAVEFPFLPAIKLLFAAAADPASRDTLPRAEWRARLGKSATHSNP